MLEISVGDVVGHIERRGANKVLLQAPDGIKGALVDSMGEIRKQTGADVYMQGDSCFGSCDLALSEGLRMGYDLIVHVGHNPYFADWQNENIVFVDAFDDEELSDATWQDLVDVASERRVGLTSSIQFLPLLHKVRRRLEERGIEPIVGKSNSSLMMPGHVMGCEVSAAKSVSGEVEAFISIGGGDFHAMGVSLGTGKPVYVADPYRDGLVDLTPRVKRTLALIAAEIDEAKDADRFGVVQGTKEGQDKPGVVDFVRKRLTEAGKDVTLFSMRELSQERLAYFPEVEAFVQTLCPRISTDDIGAYRRPVLDFDQFMIAMGEREFGEVYPW